MTTALRRCCVAVAASLLLASCMSVSVGNEGSPHTQLRLTDAAAAQPTRRAEPLIAALLIQPLPADALTDTTSIAYARRDNEFAFYQFASWTERPVRQVPRLLQRRLEARGIAGAVGLLGDPLRADWLLTVAVQTLHHDASMTPGTGRLAMTVELFDRRGRIRVARRHFETAAATTREDAPAAAAAMSKAVALAFDELLPWLEAELQRAAGTPPH
ncbi:ABC-type transport auxiliary lipoprotein family protein [Piscinibacter sakaiensis]|uniref:ABC-type transport auxiliary lipoprotein family protein n=1 Tax=Piscinibacter sakaiensis TaxID=1547922 RepID=UPI003AAD8433